jgi:integrase
MMLVALAALVAGVALMRNHEPRRSRDARHGDPAPTGRLWRERNFYRDVWYPAQKASGLDIRPHEMRHSWLTHLRVAGVDEADLADMAATASSLC